MTKAKKIGYTFKNLYRFFFGLVEIFSSSLALVSRLNFEPKRNFIVQSDSNKHHIIDIFCKLHSCGSNKGKLWLRVTHLCNLCSKTKQRARIQETNAFQDVAKQQYLVLDRPFSNMSVTTKFWLLFYLALLYEYETNAREASTKFCQAAALMLATSKSCHLRKICRLSVCVKTGFNEFYLASLYVKYMSILCPVVS